MTIFRILDRDFHGTTLNVSGKQVQILAQLVNGNFFDMLGVRPRLGRFFSPEEDVTPGARPVVVLSTALWNDRFGADPNILGKTIELNNQDYTVIGVTPANFHHVGNLGSPSVWVPMMMHDQLLTGIAKNWYNDRSFRMVSMVGRLNPNVSFTKRKARCARWPRSARRVSHQQRRAQRGDAADRSDQYSAKPAQRLRTCRHTDDDRGWIGAADRVRQRGQFIAGPRDAETARNRDPAGDGRVTLAPDPAIDYGKLASGTDCRRVWRAVCLLGASSAISLLLKIGPIWIFRLTRVLIFTLGSPWPPRFSLGLRLRCRPRSQPIDRVSRPHRRSDRKHPMVRLRGALVILQVAFSLIALVGAGLFIHSLRNAQQSTRDLKSRTNW